MRIRLIVTAEVEGEDQARWATQELDQFVRKHAHYLRGMFRKMQAENGKSGPPPVKWEPAPNCVRCGRELVVHQLLDHINRPEGTVCMMCLGGS